MVCFHVIRCVRGLKIIYLFKLQSRGECLIFSIFEKKGFYCTENKNHSFTTRIKAYSQREMINGE